MHELEQRQCVYLLIQSIANSVQIIDTILDDQTIVQYKPIYPTAKACCRVVGNTNNSGTNTTSSNSTATTTGATTSTSTSATTRTNASTQEIVVVPTIVPILVGLLVVALKEGGDRLLKKET